MLAAWSVVVVSIVVMGTAMSAAPTIEPGCSFYGGQCVYSIKLGHAGQCDKRDVGSSSASSSGCCDDLTTKYSRLNDDLDKLKTQVKVLTKAIKDAGKDKSGLEADLQKALEDRQDIVRVLNRKESELSSTKTELAKVMADAAKEVKSLRDQLSRLQNTCKIVGGGGTTTKPSTDTGRDSDTLAGDYTVNYYDFNGPTTGFTFSDDHSVKMSRLSTGSSSSTGPRVEHSWAIKHGLYLGINSNDIANNIVNPPSTFRALSGTYPSANAYCIMFWYYMEGKDVKTLTTNLKINGGTGYPVFTRTGPRGSKKWELAKINLDSEYTHTPFQIEFTMSTDAYKKWVSYHYVRQFYHGDIAVDDLYVFNTSCSSIPRHPQGDSFYDGNVTSFYTFHFTPKTWTEAYKTCRHEGPWSALVSVESAAEHAALVNMIRTSPAYSIGRDHGFYTSGTDADNEHTFSWTNTGVPREIKFDNWHMGQPNNVAGNQDCLLMEYPNDDFKWGDVNCDTKHAFICEVEVPGKVTN